MFNYKSTVIALLLTIASPLIYANDITIDNAWVREAPPVSRVQAAYAVFKNNQKNDIELVNVASPAFKKIEFHKTISEKGLTKMQQQASIIIPANNITELKPEGLHMMLFDPVKPLRAGEKIAFQFEFSNGLTKDSIFIVKKTTGNDHHQHMHH